MAVTIAISITQNSQSVANNESNVTVRLTASWTGGSYNHTGNGKGSLTIDGTSYSFSGVSFNLDRVSSGTQTLLTKTVDITHNTDGTKTFDVKASFDTGTNKYGTVAASAKKTLTTIPRKSSISVSNGTLGSPLTITVTRQSDSFTHTIGYKCGSDTVYNTIVTKSSNTTINWTPPLELAKRNTTGTTVSITLQITTLNGSANIGSSTKTISCTIPSDIVPSCDISVTDPTGHRDAYGSFLKGLSQFKIVVTPTLAYDSPIASYKTTADGASYTAASFTTGIIKTSGASIAITATVKDKRGRSGTTSRYYSVINYVEPVVSKLTVKRCDENGTENDQGAHIQVTMSMAITSLNDKNSASYTLRYKKSTESSYTEVGLDEITNVYSVADKKYIFEADTGSSYDVVVEARDDFKTTKRVTSASTAFTLMHFGNDGTSMAIGKVCEEPDLLDVGLPTRFNQPVHGKVMGLDKLPQIPNNSDFNDYMTTGCYAVYRNADAESISNMPVQKAGRLEVSAATGEGIRVSEWSYIRQRFIPYNSENAVWERDIARNESNVWMYYDWWRSSLTPEAETKIYDRAAMTIALSSNETPLTANQYIKVPLATNVISTSSRLTMTSNSIRIGKNIQYIRASGQALMNCDSVAGNRHLKIQKTSGSTVTSVSWACIYTTDTNVVFPLTPVIISVKEGDLISMSYYTINTSDSIASGSSSGGWQTYLTVEEL